MTSRYRAAQRAVELFDALQDDGLTTDEIAAELRRRGALDRKSASDPAADLLANVRDMVADFAKAMGQPPVEDALHARAEAAEQRAEALAAELAQARAEGEAAGRAAERADVVAYLRRVAEGYCSLVLHEEAEHVEAGEHVGAAETAP